MPVTAQSPTRRPVRARRRGRAPATPVPCRQHSPAASPVPAPIAQHGPSEDRALYRCDCGCDFHAHVTTTVGCPACGSAQDW